MSDPLTAYMRHERNRVYRAAVRDALITVAVVLAVITVLFAPSRRNR